MVLSGSVRGTRVIPESSVLYPDMDEMTTLGAYF